MKSNKFFAGFAGLAMAITILAGLVAAIPALSPVLALAATNGPSIPGLPGGIGWGNQNGGSGQGQQPQGQTRNAQMMRGSFGGGIVGQVASVSGTTLTVNSRSFRNSPQF